MQVIDKIETETATFYYEGDILTITFKEGADVTLENAQTNLKARKKFQKEAKVKVLADVSKAWQVSKEARAFYGTRSIVY